MLSLFTQALKGERVEADLGGVVADLGGVVVGVESVEAVVVADWADSLRPLLSLSLLLKNEKWS